MKIKQNYLTNQVISMFYSQQKTSLRIVPTTASRPNGQNNLNPTD